MRKLLFEVLFAGIVGFLFVIITLAGAYIFHLLFGSIIVRFFF